MIRRMRHDESGVSVLELMIALIVTAVISAIMLSWVIAVLRTEALQSDDLDALDQMRVAKARLVKELRFATAIDPGSSASAVTFAVELGGSEGPDLTGEIVTWSVEPDGTFLRYVDNDPDTATVEVTGLVPASSFFSYAAAATMSPITIELMADVDPSAAPGARSIRVQVHARNA